MCFKVTMCIRNDTKKDLQMSEFWKMVFTAAIQKCHDCPHDIKRIWEYEFPRKGIVPVCLPFISNDRFGVIECQQWHEWRLVSVDSIRKHWNTLFEDRQELDMLAQQLLSYLPGVKRSCDTCQWQQLPETAMYSRNECALCHLLASSPQKLAQPLNVFCDIFHQSRIQSILAQRASRHQCSMDAKHVTPFVD